MKNCNWSWRFATPAIAAELGDRPELLLEAGREVKSNPVRQVFRCGDYFLKYDRRSGRRLRSEWSCAQLIEREGIQLVEHLALGESSAGSILITRAFPKAEAVSDYFYRTYIEQPGEPAVFLNNFVHFARKVLESRLYHPDFHIGNVLYSPGLNRFALVDAQGVRKAGWFDRWFRRYSMERIGMEFRFSRTRHQMLKLLAALGIADPEEFYAEALVRESAALWHEWPRRRRQALAGYPKFSVQDGSLLRTVDPLRRTVPLENYEVLEGESALVESLFLSHFFLQLAQIPHRRVLALDRRNRQVYLEKISSSTVPTAAADYQERLNALDIHSETRDWGKDEFGRISLWNLDLIRLYV
ncbi:hypothetical protein [Victivallis vadensis]|uniref:hypothetical protein n=1 Tax=Victivallis vadensis TaxID=172901 RepID=UPI003D008CBC